MHSFGSFAQQEKIVNQGEAFHELLFSEDNNYRLCCYGNMAWFYHLVTGLWTPGPNQIFGGLLDLQVTYIVWWIGLNTSL